MSASVRDLIVKIANSQGIWLPKALLEQTGSDSNTEIGDVIETLSIKQLCKPIN
jgi:antitoxin component of MazEF toxin-antitoxin module